MPKAKRKLQTPTVKESLRGVLRTPPPSLAAHPVMPAASGPEVTRAAKRKSAKTGGRAARKGVRRS